MASWGRMTKSAHHRPNLTKRVRKRLTLSLHLCKARLETSSALIIVAVGMFVSKPTNESYHPGALRDGTEAESKSECGDYRFLLPRLDFKKMNPSRSSCPTFLPIPFSMIKYSTKSPKASPRLPKALKLEHYAHQKYWRTQLRTSRKYCM